MLVSETECNVGLGDQIGVGHIANEVGRARITPCPTLCAFQQGKLIAGAKLGNYGAPDVGRFADHNLDRRLAEDGSHIMRREQLPRERDVGEIAAIGMDAGIEDDRWSGEGEALSRAGG